MADQQKSEAGEVPCQNIEIIGKKRLRLTKKLYREANSALDAHDVKTAVRAMTLLERQYQFDLKNGAGVGQESQIGDRKASGPVALKLHQGGSIESKRQQLMERIRNARGGSGDGGGSAGGTGVDGRIAGAG